jgi:hypothetical protein
MRIALADRRLMALAGLWETWRSPAGKDPQLHDRDHHAERIVRQAPRPDAGGPETRRVAGVARRAAGRVLQEPPEGPGWLYEIKFDRYGMHARLEVVTAFTLGADHAAQLAVWRQVKDNSYIQSYTVKRLPTESAVALDSDLGMFVGTEAYEAAGGTITRDLFSGDEEGFMDDAALVRRLAIEKLEAKAAELRPQWAWTNAVLELEYGFTAQYARLRAVLAVAAFAIQQAV